MSDLPSDGRSSRRRSSAGAALVLAALAGAAPVASASGVDGAGRIVVVPLVFSGPDRESIITVTNVATTTVPITALYVGADGTPMAGANPCPDQTLLGEHTLTMSLRDLCKLSTPDVENVGYLQLMSPSDDGRPFFATSVVLTNGSAETSAIPGQPMGAYTAGWPNMWMSGLRTEGPSSPTGETLLCYVGAFDFDKKIALTLRDASLVDLGTTMVTVPAGHMLQINLVRALGLPTADRDNLQVVTASTDNASAVVGCSYNHPSTRAVAWQAAQSDQAQDTSRTTVFDVFTERKEGPFTIPMVWEHTSAGGSADRKLTLSTYLRADDTLHCRLEADPNFPSFDNTPWLELQVRAPDGVTVVAGGNRVKDTGVFSTGPRGRYKPSLGNRWFIDISFDEDANTVSRFPRSNKGGAWGLHCESAAGMSLPLGVSAPSGNTDDF